MLKEQGEYLTKLYTYGGGFDLDIEAAVLQTIYRGLTRDESAEGRISAIKLLEELEEDDFTDPRFKALLEAFRIIAKNGEIASWTLISNYLELPMDDGVMNELLDADVCLHEQTGTLVKKLRDMRYKRGIIDVLRRGTIEKGETSEEMANRIISEIATGAGLTFEKSLYKANELPEIYAERLNAPEFRKIGTKFSALDGKVDFRPGNLVIVSARTGQGKTAFALQLMLNLTTQAQPVPCMYFTMEVSALDLFERLAVNFYQQPASSIRQRALNAGGDKKAIAREFAQIARLRYCIYDKAGLKIKEIIRAIKAHILNFGTRVIFIDYLGLINVDEVGGERYNAIGEITRTLKALATELKVAIFLLVQVNRDPEKRANKTPQLSDLRDSGSVEQDADVVLFIHRPFQIALKEYYEKDAQAVAENKKRPEPPKFDPQNEPIKIVIAKNRTGQTGDINLTFMPQFQRYEEPTGYDVTTIEFKG